MLGGCGAWPAAGQACSGYLVEHDGFRLLVDPGYATTPRLLQYVGADQVDAVFVSHGHPDHCADVNPLLRVRALRDDPAPPLPLYALPGALDAVLALDRHAMLAPAYELHEFANGATLQVGPFSAQTCPLPHSLPNAGVRLTAQGQSLVYTGDCGESADLVAHARDADLLLAEASYADQVPEDSRSHLSSAAQAGRQATAADVGRLVLTHLFPETDPVAALEAGRRGFSGDVQVATAGLALTSARDPQCLSAGPGSCRVRGTVDPRGPIVPNA